jgi:hypothetical protein
MVGLTVLLEKTPGNNKIHKMRGIVLVEGDFNLFYEGGLSETDAQIGAREGPGPSRVFCQEGQQLH